MPCKLYVSVPRRQRARAGQWYNTVKTLPFTEYGYSLAQAYAQKQSRNNLATITVHCGKSKSGNKEIQLVVCEEGVCKPSKLFRAPISKKRRKADVDYMARRGYGYEDYYNESIAGLRGRKKRRRR